MATEHQLVAGTAEEAEQLRAMLASGALPAVSPSCYGPMLWQAMHQMLRAYPSTNPPDETQNALRQFVLSLAQLLPCKICAMHWAQLAPTVKTGSRYEALKWSIDAHNTVNKRLGKPVLSYSSVAQLLQSGAGSNQKLGTPTIVIIVLGVLLVAAIAVAVGLGVTGAARAAKRQPPPPPVTAPAPAIAAITNGANAIAGGLFGTPASNSNALAGGLGSPEAPAVIPGPPLATASIPSGEGYAAPPPPTNTQPEPVRPVETATPPQPQPQPQQPLPLPLRSPASLHGTVGGNLSPASDRRKTSDPLSQPAELASAAAALVSPASSVDALASFRPGQHTQPLAATAVPVVQGGQPPSVTYGAATLTAEQAVAMIQHPGQQSTLFVVSSTCGFCHKLGSSLKELIVANKLNGEVVGVLPVEEVAKIADRLPPIAGVPQGFKVGMGKVVPGPKGALPPDMLLAFITAREQ